MTDVGSKRLFSDIWLFDESHISMGMEDELGISRLPIFLLYKPLANGYFSEKLIPTSTILEFNPEIPQWT